MTITHNTWNRNNLKILKIRTSLEKWLSSQVRKNQKEATKEKQPQDRERKNSKNTNHIQNGQRTHNFSCNDSRLSKLKRNSCKQKRYKRDGTVKNSILLSRKLEQGSKLEHNAYARIIKIRPQSHMKQLINQKNPSSKLEYNAYARIIKTRLQTHMKQLIDQ